VETKSDYELNAALIAAKNEHAKNHALDWQRKNDDAVVETIKDVLRLMNTANDDVELLRQALTVFRVWSAEREMDATRQGKGKTE